MKTEPQVIEKQCACCGKPLPSLHDMAAKVPDALKNNPSLQSEFQGTEDVMVWNRSDGARIFFLRGVAKIPVQDHPKEFFGLGLWLEVNEEDARAYASTWKKPEAIQEATWSGSIANSIRGYPETIGTSAKALYSSKSNQKTSAIVRRSSQTRHLHID